MSLGIWEILAIAMVALLFFGPSRLPGLGQSVGEAIRGFKKGMDGLDEESSKTAPKNAQGPTSAPQAEALKQEAQPMAGASAEAATQESTKQTSGNGSKPT